MPHLEDDPLGGDPFDSLFSPDSGDDEIPCGQKDNLAKIFELAERLATPVPAQMGELRAPPASRSPDGPCGRPCPSNRSGDAGGSTAGGCSTSSSAAGRGCPVTCGDQSDPSGSV